MKKLIALVCASMLIAFTAHAEKRIGISAAYTMFDSSGTETTKSSDEKNSASKDEDVVVPSIFFEIANDSGLALGIDYVPVEAELGASTNARTDTDTDDASDTAGDNKASAELSDHITIYALMPLGDTFYLKAGLARATVDTTETLATGTTYGNEDVDGRMIGFGLNRDLDSGLFFRAEATYTDYDDVKLNGSFNGNAAGDSAVRNTVDADVDATALRISVGKSF